MFGHHHHGGFHFGVWPFGVMSDVLPWLVMSEMMGGSRYGRGDDRVVDALREQNALLKAQLALQTAAKEEHKAAALPYLAQEEAQAVEVERRRL